MQATFLQKEMATGKKVISINQQGQAILAMGCDQINFSCLIVEKEQIPTLARRAKHTSHGNVSC